MKHNQSVKNVSVSFLGKLVLLVTGFLVRRYLIRYLGNDINGINSLYLSIIGVLAVAELGIGDAIIFCMYRPIVNGDTEKVAALYGLFQKLYRIIGAVIVVSGCLVMPFLPYLAKGYSSSELNLYSTFLLMLISVALSYMFSAGTSLMNAYRDNYISTMITSGGQLIQQILQIAVIFITRSFEWYLICRIVAVLLQWVITEIVVRKKYSEVVLARRNKFAPTVRVEIVKSVKATFMHRVGSVLVNTIDSLIISAFIGVAVLGKYSNYTTVAVSMTGVLVLFFSPLISTIGHLFVRDKMLCENYYHFFYTFNFILGYVFFLGYHSVIDDLIFLLFGDGLQLSRSVSFVITVNYFIQFMRQATLMFRDATGTFYYDRWKPLFEGLSNLILSIVFVKLFRSIAGDDFAVIGVIVATIITNVLICHIIEPYVLHKHAFGMSPKHFYLRNYSYIAIFILTLLALECCRVTLDNVWLELLVNGIIAVGISLVPITGAILLDKHFRHFAGDLLTRHINILGRKS